MDIHGTLTFYSFYNCCIFQEIFFLAGLIITDTGVTSSIMSHVTPSTLSLHTLIAKKPNVRTSFWLRRSERNITAGLNIHPIQQQQ